LHFATKHFSLYLVPLVKPHPLIADLADRAFRAGVEMPALCRAAGVPSSTWRRWVAGGAHRSDTLDRLNAALHQLIEDNNAKGLNGAEAPYGGAGS
jgi:hypothetical protein